jgi:uncharacterized protein (TIGR02452 family)
LAELRRQELAIRPELAKSLGRSALEAIENGFYLTDNGKVDWKDAIERAQSAKISISPDMILPTVDASADVMRTRMTSVVVRNETTLAAARCLYEAGQTPLALNFANGVEPGGGFLRGATAQEEALCRSSALYATLWGDPMYAFHRNHDPAASSDWAILSPKVPVFRDDRGRELDRPWSLCFLTCAAPYALSMGRVESAKQLRLRIDRVLSIARAYRYDTLVLGAWGCGAFGNDPLQTAKDFRDALEGMFVRTFAHIIFAIADWSDERRFLGPFRDVFSED